MFDMRFKKQNKEKEEVKDIAHFVFKRMDTGLTPEDDPQSWGLKYTD